MGQSNRRYTFEMQNDCFKIEINNQSNEFIEKIVICLVKSVNNIRRGLAITCWHHICNSIWKVIMQRQSRPLDFSNFIGEFCHFRLNFGELREMENKNIRIFYLFFKPPILMSRKNMKWISPFEHNEVIYIKWIFRSCYQFEVVTLLTLLS